METFISQNTHLHATNYAIRNLGPKEMTPGIVFAAPAPHILTIAVGFARVQNACSHTPHDDTKGVEYHGECCVVSCNLLTLPVSLFPECANDEH